MKKIFFFFFLFFFLVAGSLFAQQTNFVVSTADNVASYSIKYVTDTVYAGTKALKTEFVPGMGTGQYASVVWKEGITPTSVGVKIKFQAMVPNYADAPRAVFSLKGGSSQSATTFIQLDQGGGWKLYEANLNTSGFTADTLYVGVSSADLQGVKVAFFDNISIGYSSGDTVVEDGESSRATLNPPVLVLPTNGATNVVTDPVLSWNAVPGSTRYNLQISTVSDFSSFSSNQTLTDTSIQMSGLLANTTYYWRVNATDGTNLSAWSSVWSFVTAQDVPAPPSFSYPANNATGVPITFDIPFATIQLWKVEVQVTKADGSVAFDGVSASSPITVSPALLYNTDYYLRGRYVSLDGSIVGDWSATVHFKTIQESAPAPPAVVYPGTTNVPLSFTLNWTTISGWVLRVRIVDAIGNVAFNQTSATGSITVSGLNCGTSYVGQVRWESQDGGIVGDWSQAVSFSTVSCTVTIAQVQLISPENDATGINYAPAVLSWGVASNATVYEYQLAKSSDFSVLQESGTTSNTSVQAQLDPITSYYWRVRGKDGTIYGLWSSIRNFLTKASIATGIGDGKEMPKEFSLSQNYPNPFNPTTVIQYSVPAATMVTLKVYDILGREVETLVNEEKPVGRYEVNFDASRLSSGLYIYRLTAGDNFISVKKMILFK